MAFDIEKAKENYLNEIYLEMDRRGYTSEEIPSVINKTGFISALNNYPEISIEDAVDEILFTAAKINRKPQSYGWDIFMPVQISKG